MLLKYPRTFNNSKASIFLSLPKIFDVFNFWQTVKEMSILAKIASQIHLKNYLD